MIVLGLATVACSGFAFLVSPFVAQPALGTLVIRVWSWIILRTAGIRFQVEGLENLPAESGIVVFNHTSHFDIPVLMQALPRHIRFGAKVELFKIPVFGSTMRLFGMLPIERSQREKVLDLYKKSVPRVKNGEWFCLAPEGTRQSGKELGAFKKGPFIFAIAAQCSVVPVVLRGLSDVLPKGEWIVNRGKWNACVVVEILPPISATGMVEADIERLTKSAFEAMNRQFLA